MTLRAKLDVRFEEKSADTSSKADDNAWLYDGSSAESSSFDGSDTDEYPNNLDPELLRLLKLTNLNHPVLHYSFCQQMTEQHSLFIKKTISNDAFTSWQQKTIHRLKALNEPNAVCASFNNPSITAAFIAAINLLGHEFFTSTAENNDPVERHFIAYQNQIDALLKLIDSLVKYTQAINQLRLANEVLPDLEQKKQAHVNQLQQELVQLLQRPTPQAIRDYQDKIDDSLTSIDYLSRYEQSYEKARDELAQADLQFNGPSTQQFINLRKKQLLACQNRQDVVNTNNALKNSVEMMQALTTLKKTLDVSAREEVEKVKTNPTHFAAMTVYTEGVAHAVELLQEPQVDATYQTTFTRTLNNATHTVANKNKPAENVNQIQELHRDAKKLQGAPGGYGKKFWFAIGQLVLGAIGFAIGILAEVGITIKTGGVNIAFGGSPFWHVATASGALMLTGGATLFSNRHKLSKAVSNLANTATAKPAAPKPQVASPAPIALPGRAVGGAPQPPASPPLADDSKPLSGKDAAARDAGTFDYDPRVDHPSPQIPGRRG